MQTPKQQTDLLMLGRSAHALPSGYCLDQWEIQYVIGEGGFSLVYQAFDKDKQCEVAIKEYFPASISIRTSSQEVIARHAIHLATFNRGKACFYQEAEILSRIHHPYIPHFLGSINKNNTVYIVTTLHHGFNLKKWYKDSPKALSQHWLTEFLLSLLDTVNAIHIKGYLHLDISWDNIQLQDKATPILLDFGSARAFLTEQQENILILKLGFSPPELYYHADKENVGPWSDIYAIGALVYALITGELPPVSLVRSIEDHYQPLGMKNFKGYSSDFLKLIDKLLSIDIRTRPQTINSLIKQIKMITENK